MLRVALAAILAVVLAAATAGGAHAHAQLVSAMPGEGAVLSAPPPVLALRFNEPVNPVSVKLIGPDGTATAVTVRASGVTVEVAPVAALAEGPYVVSYRVISADGHPVAGALPFSVGTKAHGHGAHADRVTAADVILVTAARALGTVGLLFGLGGAAAVAWLGPLAPAGAGPARRVALGALLAGSFGYAAGLLLLGRELADGWAGAASAVLATSLARSTVLWFCAAAAATIALRGPGRGARAGSAAALLLGAAALAATGHAATAPPAWAAVPGVLAHGLAGMIWAGPLPFLAAVATARDPALPVVLRRFSSAAMVAVAILALAGVTLAVLQLRSPADLLDTAYGRLLCVKLILAAGLLGIAALNRLWLTPAAGRGSSLAATRLRRTIVAEIGLMAMIAVAVAGWRFTPPPRALVTATADQRHVHLHGADAMVDVTLVTGRVGPNRVTVVPMTPEFAPLEPRDVVVTFSLPSAGIEGLERRLVRTPEGPWVDEGLNLPLPGRWSLRVDLLVSDFDKVMLDGEIEVLSPNP